MEIKGKVVEILDLQKGTSARGPWQKRYAVIETEAGKYPKKVCLMFWGDLAENPALQKGNDITASIDIESREYNGRWYTDVKVRSLLTGSAPQAPATSSYPPLSSPSDSFSGGESFDQDNVNDLPF